MAPCRCAPSLIQLRSEVDERWPRRDRSSDGCCGDADHQARKSDHNPFYGYAHALDIDEDINPGANLNWLVSILMADRRTKYVIYEGLIHYPGSRPRKYTGINAHRQHLHVSIKTTATHDTSLWLPLADEEDWMAALSDDEQRELYAWTKDLHAALAELFRPTHAAVKPGGPIDRQLKEIRRNTRPTQP